MSQKEIRGSIKQTKAVEALKSGNAANYTDSREQRRVKFGFRSSKASKPKS